MSSCLSERSIDHVVLERGEVAHTWRTERWDSLRLLTPNWQSRLPGFSYIGDDPDGYRILTEVIAFIASYADAISAPVSPSEGWVAGDLGRVYKTTDAGQSWSLPVHATSLTFPALPIRCRGQSCN